MRAAIVHDYFLARGGAERVAAHIAAAFSDAPIYTSAYRAERLPAGIDPSRVIASRLQRVPAAASLYRVLLPLYPLAFDRMRLDAFDVVIASSSAWAHTVTTDAPVVVYCHTPPRFLWESESYGAHDKRVVRLAIRAMGTQFAALRTRDVAAAHRARRYVANSSATAARIRRIYGVDPDVVFPPVETERFSPAREREGFALVVSRLQAYKRLDVAVLAAQRAGIELRVVGEGPARRQLERLAGPRTHFLGRVADRDVAHLLGRASVLVVPGEEDFGLTPVEAAASGCPVVAFRRGGALDTVIDEKTGILVDGQSPEVFASALLEVISRDWSTDDLVSHAAEFAPARFATRLRAICDSAVRSARAGAVA